MPGLLTRVVTTRAATPPDAGADGAPGAAGAAPARSVARPAVVVAALLALVGLPLVVAAVGLRRPHWYPVLDLAMTELRLRDVGTGETPLIGLPGRIGPSLTEQGSHPGPLSFYLLAPTYRLAGSSSWAMQAAAVVLNLVALGATLALAVRRGGARMAVAVGALLAVLVWGYGIGPLTEPWNPYLPLLWWPVLLLAVWSVACGDVAMLPVVVFAGSFCAQTHVPYLALALGLGAVAVVAAVVAWRQAAPGSRERSRVLRWGLASLALGVVLWAPPLIDQATNDPGNIRRIYDHLATPSEDPVGPVTGVELALTHLNVAGWVGGGSGSTGPLVEASSHEGGSILPGLALLAVWAAAAVVAIRMRHRALVALHAVVAAGLVFGVLSLSRIFGKVWYYLTLWAWGVTGLLLVAVAWTVLAALGPRLVPAARARLGAGLTGALLVVAVVASAAATVDAAGVDPPEPHLSATLGELMGPTIAALDRGEGAATGRDGRYAVTWSDAYYFGSQGYGIVSELERAGFDAGAAPPWHVPITDHRVVDPEEATAVVHMATGLYVDRWRSVPGAVEVAYVEPRSAAELDEFERLRAEVVGELRDAGLDDLVPLVDSNLFGVSIDERVPSGAEERMARMLELGEPTAMFIAPPGTSL
jgi:hypothetical protein